MQADFEGRCLLLVGDEACEPTPLNIPWTDVILACINYRLQSTDFTDPNSSDDVSRSKINSRSTYHLEQI